MFGVFAGFLSQSLYPADLTDAEGAEGEALGLNASWICE